MRYILDENHIIAGLGHVMAGFNPILRLSLKHNLTIVRPYEPSRLRKVYWSLRSNMGKLTGYTSRRASHEKHEGTLFGKYSSFLNLKKCGVSNKSILKHIQKHSNCTIEIPPLRSLDEENQGNELDYSRADGIIEKHAKPGTVFMLPHQGPKRTDANYTETANWIRARFDDIHTSPFSNTKLIQIVTNIRRGDVVGNPLFRNRLLPDSYFATIINQLVDIFGSPSIEFLIYSDCERFGQYVDSDGEPRNWNKHPFVKSKTQIKYIHRSSWHEALVAMRFADILITSKSGFSHLGSVLNNRMVLAAPMWHQFIGNNVFYPSEMGQLKDSTVSALKNILPA